VAPLVSIIIPTFNRAQYVEQAVRSVLAQTLSDYEIVIIDDGSTDYTEELLLPFKHRSNFRCQYQSNQGRSTARNKGIGLAAGKLLLFLDSDDLLLPEALEHLCQAAALHPTAGMIIGQTQFIDEQMKVLRTLAPWKAGTLADSLYPALIRQRFALLPGAFVVTRNALEKCGSFDSLSEPCEDYDFSLRLALYSQLQYVDKPVVQHRMHAGNTPETSIYLGGLKVALKHLTLIDRSSHLPFTLRRKSKAAWLLKMADNYYGLAENMLALKYYLRAFRVYPRCADLQMARQVAASLVPVEIRKKLKPFMAAPIANDVW